MRKLSVMLALILLLSTVFAFPAQADENTPLGNLTYWYASIKDDEDPYYIGYWSQDSTVAIGTLEHLSSFSLDADVDTAIYKWNYGLSISVVDVTATDDYADINFRSGSFSDLALRDKYDITDSSIHGYTHIVNGKTIDGYYLHSNTKRYAFNMREVLVYILAIDGKTTTQYTNTVIHEMGHALGYIGHDSNTNAIMQPTNTSITTLSSRDKNHIKQMFD